MMVNQNIVVNTITEKSSDSVSNPRESLVDLEHLEAICGGDLEFEQEVLQMFVEDTVENLEAAREALGNSDCEVLLHNAHQIKGSSANVGVPSITEIASRLETQARQKSLVNAPELIDSLTELLVQVRAFIHNRCG
ncbi:MAG: Hpt domain-containing protein [Oscillatoria sp. SIO1A7]|nr:Hpt domain-containing protein [Oscillatoria sp. SIO1A7]